MCHKLNNVHFVKMTHLVHINPDKTFMDFNVSTVGRQAGFINCPIHVGTCICDTVACSF